MVDLETLVRKVTLGFQGLLGGMDLPECQDRPGHKGPEEQQDLQVWKDPVGLLDPWALQVLPVSQDFLELPYL